MATFKRWMTPKRSAAAKASRDKWNTRAERRKQAGKCLYCDQPRCLVTKPAISDGHQLFSSKGAAASILGITEHRVERWLSQTFSFLQWVMVEVDTGRCEWHRDQARLAQLRFRERHPEYELIQKALHRGRQQMLASLVQ